MLRILSALAALAKTTSTQSVTAGIPPSVMQSTTASTVTTGMPSPGLPASVNGHDPKGSEQ